MKRRLALAITLTLGLVGCDSARILGVGWRPLPTTAEYTQWWAEMEMCSGLSGDLSAITFYAAPDPEIVLNGVAARGWWLSEENIIVLIESRITTEFAVKHEMMHALVRTPGHPHEYFDADRGCGNLWW